MSEAHSVSDNLFTMLQLQRALNDRDDADWYARKHPFLRSAVMAAAAALGHYGCKLWESHEPDLPQVRNDLTEILGLLLSQAMARKGRRDEELYRTAREIEDIYNSVLRKDAHFGIGFPEKMEMLAAKAALRADVAAWSVYFSAITDVGLEWETMTRAYFSENVLKLFRQDYAQDDKAYAAAWGDKKDSDHLEEIISDMEKLNLAEIRQALVKRYSIYSGRRATDAAEPPRQ